MIEADPSGKWVVHVDLGLDQILVWKFDGEQGTLTPAETPIVSLPPGDGPRHFAFHPNGRWFYSIQEEGSTVALFDFDAQTGRLTHRQTLPSLPPGYAGSNFCSEILVSADGRFVYAGNRLHDSIGIFAEGGLSGEAAVHGAPARWMEWRGQKDTSLRRVTVRFATHPGPCHSFVRRNNPLAALPFQYDRDLSLPPGGVLNIDHTLTFTDA